MANPGVCREFPDGKAPSRFELLLDAVANVQVRAPERSTGVYFIQEADGPIKIGIAADPVGRLRGLQCGNPRELLILGWIEAPARLEPVLHSHLSAHRLTGEWFEPHPDVLDALTACVAVFGKPECPECDREARYIMAGVEIAPSGSLHRCGRDRERSAYERLAPVRSPGSRQAEA